MKEEISPLRKIRKRRAPPEPAPVIEEDPGMSEEELSKLLLNRKGNPKINVYAYKYNIYDEDEIYDKALSLARHKTTINTINKQPKGQKTLSGVDTNAYEPEYLTEEIENFAPREEVRQIIESSIPADYNQYIDSLVDLYRTFDKGNVEQAKQMMLALGGDIQKFKESVARVFISGYVNVRASISLAPSTSISDLDDDLIYKAGIIFFSSKTKTFTIIDSGKSKRYLGHMRKVMATLFGFGEDSPEEFANRFPKGNKASSRLGMKYQNVEDLYPGGKLR